MKDEAGTKFRYLQQRLAREEKDEVTLSFEEIDELILSDEPFSAKDLVQYKDTWIDGGWRVIRVDEEKETVTFIKLEYCPFLL